MKVIKLGVCSLRFIQILEKLCALSFIQNQLIVLTSQIEEFSLKYLQLFQDANVKELFS